VSARIWFARDTGFTADPTVQAIGEAYGPGGPLALEEMMALAKLNNKEGSFTTSYSVIARRAFITAARVRSVVHQAANPPGESTAIIKLIDEDAKHFTARFVRWATWQPKDPTGAQRKARHRARQRHGDVT
jgi:hypothetical protein